MTGIPKTIEPSATVGANEIVVMLPIATPSPNATCSLRLKMRRKMDQRLCAAGLVRPYALMLDPPYRIHLVRMSPGTLDDDNLRGALKHIRDGVSDALGYSNDAHTDLVWHYVQALSTRHGVMVKIERVF